ncbi:MAG TPA: hypothetical protein VGD66_02065 [Allosphingosinicella sp.]|jgi:uncharacterized phiE125 gp8 family phage protein
MIESDALSLPPQAAAEAAGFLRAGGAGEEALIGALTQSAAELCERFTGLVLLARGFAQTLRPDGAWQRLGRTPVRAISGIEAVPPAGAPEALPAAAYALDIDAQGDGWVRIADPAAARRVRISYQAGIAVEWDGVPAALRHGVTRLAAHLYSLRGGEAGELRSEPPAAVTALWRPYRRLRLV